MANKLSGSTDAVLPMGNLRASLRLSVWEVLDIEKGNDL